MSGFMLHGLGDCTPERHCGCLDIPAMTAPEPTPTADEHTDAVARACLLALHDQTCPEGGDCRARWPHAAASGWFDGPRFIRDVSNAAAIHEALAANLPADVMLDALVRAGVLTEDVAPHSLCNRDGWHDQRCYRTPWEVATVHRQMPNSLAPTECPCASCLTEAGVSAWWMIVCDECGNKRCPHGTDHRQDCTGSNEPGQAGSRYAAPPEVAP